MRFAREGALAYGGIGVLATAVAFAAALGLDARESLRRHIVGEASDIAWVVFLKRHGDKSLVEESIRSFPGIRAIRFISKEEALETVQRNPELSQSLTLTGRNPFPESFDVRWSPFFLRADFLEHTAEKIGGAEGVDHVGYDRPRVERFGEMQRLLYQLELAFLGLLWGTAFLLVLFVGRMLFFPKELLPDRSLWLSAAAGFLGGAAGIGLSLLFVETAFWSAILAGAATGLLVALLRDAFRSA